MVLLPDSFVCVILHERVVIERTGISKYKPVEEGVGDK